MRRLLYLAALSLVAVLFLVPTAGAQEDATGAQSDPQLWQLWVVALSNAGAGLLGGLTSAYIINNRSLLPEMEAEDAGVKTSKRSRWSSYLGNGGLGFVAAGVFWAGYSANSAADVAGQGTLTYISLATSFFIGMGGTKWLQSERDKGRWQAAAGSAALAKPDPQLQLRLSLASSDQAPQIAAEAAFNKLSSGRSSRTRGASNTGADEPARSNPQENAGPPVTPDRRGDTVRAIGKSPEQTGG